MNGKLIRPADRIDLGGTDWKMKEFVGMDWIWRDSVKQESPDVRWWYPASVPGSVLHDLMENGLVPDPYYELNSRLAEWAPERTWVYKKEFYIPEELEGRQITLVFEGIDYSSEIFLNGESLGKQEGMFVPWSLNISERLQYGSNNLLAVVLEPAPFEQPQVGKTSLVTTHKSRMTYWWDFCPRMIHQGIWQEVYLLVNGEARLTDVYLHSSLSEEMSEAEVSIEVEAEGAEGCTLEGRFGEHAFTGILENGRCTVVLHIDNPRLWWCNGQGEPYEYPVEVRLLDRLGEVSDRRTLAWGIRKIEFLPNEETVPGREDVTASKTGSFTLCLNGRKVYMNGYNWVPADVMYGAVPEDTYARLIRLAREAGVNILRVWGGGLIERDIFYGMCAQAGILVWQEFILSSSGIDNTPSVSEAYKELMRGQAESIIRQKRGFTALAVWCGGNELQDEAGMPLSEEHPLLQVMGEQVKRLDRDRKWLPTSPSGGVFLNSFENLEKCPGELLDVHGPWEHQGLEKHCELYNQGTCMLHSEFGVEGMTNYEALRKTTAPEHFLPASKDNAYYFHRGAWWNNEPLVQKTFGGLKEIEKIRKGSQFMQYEGLKYAVECNRRRAFHNSGTFPWQFNEPYPNLYCTSSLDYYGNPKPAYYGVKKVYSPYLVNASFDSASLYGQEALEADIYMAANVEAGVAPGGYEVLAQVYAMDGRTLMAECFSSDKAAMSAAKVGNIRLPLEKLEEELLLLRLFLRRKTDGTVLAENEYLFTRECDLGAVFRMEEPELKMACLDTGVEIENLEKTAALFLFLTREDGNPVYWKENYFTLLPGEKRIAAGEGDLKEASVQALNVEYRKIRR